MADTRELETPVRRLSKWFESHCDGEWEHHHGISIESCDNPGWWVNIGLEDTNLKGRSFTPMERGNCHGLDPQAPWLRCYVEGTTFHGAGDTSTLDEILEVFLGWAESG